ncbi:MAG: PBP1A family penicillin-binding protein [Sphingomonas adhaesiva]|uniref:transglycosylase domain-containing protein n=1 Tax=Sphingomonas adhaesiva TaxID=28212 RepID=UPI002FF498D6
MRPDPFENGRVRYNHAPGDTPATPLPSFGDWHDAAPPPSDPYSGRSGGGGGGDEPPRRPRWRFAGAGVGGWIVRGIAAVIVLFVVAVVWLAVTAPLSRSLKPPTPPSITLTAADGTPIARRGAIIGAPVDAATLPPHVREAFIAIEDRRFYSHWGIDPRGIARAAWANVGSGGVRQGGSTITQQLAKNAFLDSDRTAARKIREVMIAFWLEAWLTKDEILSRYLSNVYFGDNVYGITAASKHYFGRTPQKLNIGQAAMLAGLVKAPSRLAPTGNLKGARARQAVVVGAMVDAGFLTQREADRVQPQRVLADRPETLPTGTYFADWVLPSAREVAGDAGADATVRTTLDRTMQATAERVVRQAGLRQAQAALVAMKPDGEVVAMVGGRDYRASPFNRAVQARRQPGSTFKLFVYLAALRAGLHPDTVRDDSPVEIAGWKPKNDDGRYLGPITLQRAFARSSNVVAARLTQEVGVRNVIKTARDLGITTPIPNEATIGLGTAEVSLLELTSAYAAVAAGRYPVVARGVEGNRSASWYEAIAGRDRAMPGNIRDEMKQLLGSSIRGTGRDANLPVQAFGKTGTSQGGRDAWFIGFAGDLVVGVWVGNDDSTPNPGLHGGGIPAQIWRQFMMSALNIPVVVAPIDDEDMAPIDNVIDAFGEDVGGQVQDALQGAPEQLDQAVDRLRDLGIELPNPPAPRGPRERVPLDRAPDERDLPPDDGF